MHEISFRAQTADQITQQMAGRRLAGAVNNLQERTLRNLFLIARRSGHVSYSHPELTIYHLGSGKFDARFCCEPELRERGSAEEDSFRSVSGVKFDNLPTSFD